METKKQRQIKKENKEKMKIRNLAEMLLTKLINQREIEKELEMLREMKKKVENTMMELKKVNGNEREIEKLMEKRIGLYMDIKKMWEIQMVITMEVEMLKKQEIEMLKNMWRKK